MPARKKQTKVIDAGSSTPAEASSPDGNSGNLPPPPGELRSGDPCHQFTSILVIIDVSTGASKGSLKEFIEQYKDKHYHAIEMRIVLVCSFGVFAKIFFSSVLTDLDNPVLSFSVLFFIACEWGGLGLVGTGVHAVNGPF